METQASEQDRNKWDKKYDKSEYLYGTEPVEFLKKHHPLLPKKGKALDLAMGEGRNAVYLATLGYDVTGMDISKKGIEKAHRLAKKHDVQIHTQTVDLQTATLPKNSYDLIVVTYYLQRNLFQPIRDALRPGGVVVFETFDQGHLKYQPGFKKEYLLRQRELLEEFASFRFIRYQEVDDGKKSFVSLLAQKPN